MTGGLGNIGLVLAQFLASAAQARLVLLTRSEFPRRQQWTAWLKAHAADDPVSLKIRRLQAIESNGSEVLVARADVADAVQMSDALHRVYAHFGTLNGVIHGAGNVASDGFFGIDQADRDLCERQFQAKVRGVIVLEQVLRRRKLDFVVLLSSISSVLSGLGYVAYSAGNGFMDAFAHKYAQRSGYPWISINWDTWDFDRHAQGDDDPARLGMLPEEGVDALGRILAGALLPQIVVSTGDLWARIDQWIDPRRLKSARDAQNEQSARLHSRPELANPYVAPSSHTERTIAEIWQETLGIAQVGLFDNFFLDLSGSSLLATQVASLLRTRFKIDLPLRRFFAGPTISELSAVINAQREGERGARSVQEMH